MENTRKLIGDSQVKSLLIYRISILADDVDGEEHAACTIKYGVKLNVQYVSQKETSVAFIKKGMVIENDKKIGAQLHVINFENSTPFDTLHSYISNAVSPFFKSYVKTSGKSDREGDKMVPSVEKKIAELEMGLLHLQQNIDIPEITLQIHPVVQNIINKAEMERRKISPDDYADKAEDSTFLNALQNGVNRWIREIQKVSKVWSVEPFLLFFIFLCFVHFKLAFMFFIYYFTNRKLLENYIELRFTLLPSVSHC